MQPKPMPGIVLAKAKNAKEIVDLGFETPSSFGKDERTAGFCQVIEVGGLDNATVERLQRTYSTLGLKPSADMFSVDATYNITPGDILVFAPFGDFKVSLGGQEWIFIELKHIIANLGKPEGK